MIIKPSLFLVDKIDTTRIDLIPYKYDGVN